MEIESLLAKLPNITSHDFHLSDRDYVGLKGMIDKELGQGGIGSVYSLKGDGKLILKVQDPCNHTIYGGNKIHQTNAEYCRSLSPEKGRDTVYVVPHTPGKRLIMLPASFSEALIGGYLTRLVEQNLTPHFVKYKNVGYRPAEKITYIAAERLKTDLHEALGNRPAFYTLLFQLSQGLSVAQEEYLFTHYDLHPENILYEELDPNIAYVRYPIWDTMDQKVVWLNVKNKGFLAKINDFGFSRLESDQFVINSRVDYQPHRTWGVFNPRYDIMAFFGGLMNMKTKVSDNVRCTIPASDFSDIMGDLYNDERQHGESAEQHVARIRDVYYSKGNNGQPTWRPKSFTRIEWFNVDNVHDMVYYFASKLVKMGVAYFSDAPPQGSYKEIAARKSFRIPDLVKKIGYVNTSPTNDTITNVFADGMMLVGRYIEQVKKIPFYERTPSNGRTESCKKSNVSIQHTYITEAHINSVRASKAGYKFQLGCCKIDPHDYMIHNKFYGVAINGAFYDIKETYIPTGPFQMTNKDGEVFRVNTTASDAVNPLPAEYAPYYAIVALKDDGAGLEIVSSGDSRQVASKYRNFFSSGPLLVRDGKAIFTEDRLMDTGQFGGQNNVSIMQCIPGPRGTPVMEAPDAVYREIKEDCSEVKAIAPAKVVNCDAIRAGDFAHASNPNPRSMLVIRDPEGTVEGSDIVLVVFEGRDDRGDGVNIAEMTGYALNVLHAKFAINLDGGASSNIAIRSPKGITGVVNQSKMSQYPVGAILGMVKPQ